ncbi:SufD family Fe-S cluster assembly protein [Acidovorax sp. YS12]|nr:SufD family Fe-S cluster assembly protein [Acidovorax sp. YS12]
MNTTVAAPSADRLAARAHLQQQGWITRRSEAFQHLPPPALEHWLGSADATAGLPSSGWTLHPLDGDAAARVQARWLDAHDPAQRAELLAGLPAPGADTGDAAPFAWAHRALCRQGLRLHVGTPEGAVQRTVHLALHHQPQDAAEAPLLVLDVAPGTHCLLLETHERTAPDAPATAQNLHIHIHLGAGAHLQHLRVVAPLAHDLVAHHVHATLAPQARYAQALAATGSAYHLQRSHFALQGAGARARQAALLLAGAQQLDHQARTDLQAAQAASQVESLALAQGGARAVSNAYTRIAPGADGADVRQRLTGIPLAGHPRLVLRPHLEILHDNVQAAHGATWGALPEEALFYAAQRGLDDARARALITEGMARAVLKRALDDSPLLAEWLEGGWLARQLERQARTSLGDAT